MQSLTFEHHIYLFTSCKVMNSLREALLFVVKPSCCSQTLCHLQFFWAPRGDDGHGTKQTNQLNGSCSNPAGSSVSQHHFALLHLSCRQTAKRPKNLILSALLGLLHKTFALHGYLLYLQKPAAEKQ